MRGAPAPRRPHRGLTPQVGHLPAPVIYLAATAWVGVLSWLGVKGFENRVVT